VDPIQPITPGPLTGLGRTVRAPVERPERVSRERDRPAKDGGQRKHRDTPAPESQKPPASDDGRPHIDVRA
jgi:hypothetical protein